VASDGVTINCVIPGRIDTERLRTIDYARAKRLNQPLEIIQQQSRAGIPIGRYGRPEEFADVVTFLGSQNASYATGAMWRVDGGLISSI
jgi:3-oxoacyl-[acyl-carrier protein] reductase